MPIQSHNNVTEEEMVLDSSQQQELATTDMATSEQMLVSDSAIDALLDEEQLGDLREGDNVKQLEGKGSKISMFVKALRTHWKAELKEVFALCWPILISSVCGALLGTTDMAFVGRLGKDYLAAAALGNAIFYCASFIPVGFLGAQDTLISQAEGAGNDRMKHIVLSRSIFIITLAVIPILILFMFTEQILLLIGQEKNIAALTGQFTMLNGIGLWPFCIMRMLSRYLTAQRYVYFPMIGSICSVFINAGMNYLMIFGVGYKGLGFSGAPLATSCTRLFITFLLIGYTIYVERKRSMKEPRDPIDGSLEGEVGGSRSTILLERAKILLKNTCQPRGIFEYLKLAIPASTAMCLEIWGFELTTVLAGLLGDSAFLGAHSIILNVTVVTFMLPLAVSIAASIRIGISLGAKEAEKARVVSTLGVLLSIVIMAGNAIVLFSTRTVIGRMFTEEKQVLTLVATVLPIGAMFQIFDGAQVALGGVLRGTGKQAIGAIANFVSYYVIGLPVGCLLCFYFQWKLSGLWVGLLLGLFSVSMLLIFYIGIRVDFEEEVKKAQDRVKRSDVPDEDLTNLVDEEMNDIQDPIQDAYVPSETSAQKE